jgi:hypothetical protein
VPHVPVPSPAFDDVAGFASYIQDTAHTQIRPTLTAF